MIRRQQQKTNKSRNERGQVGIGTLIVFIALVLVAAIAAGVLINTAGFLQSQAESTGQESTSQVADNLEIVSTIGQVSSSEVTTMKIIVTQGAGSGTVDLEQLTIEFVGPDGSNTLGFTAAENNNPETDANDYGVSPIVSSTDENVLAESQDQFAINIGLGDGTSDNSDNDGFGASGLTNLQSDEDATLTITTAQGSQRSVDITVPGTVGQTADGEEIRL